MSLPRQLARTRRFTLGVPAQPAIAPDGNTVFFVRTRSGTDAVSCLWALDGLTEPGVHSGAQRGGCTILV